MNCTEVNVSVSSFCSKLWFDNRVLVQRRKNLHLSGVCQLASL